MKWYELVVFTIAFLLVCYSIYFLLKKYRYNRIILSVKDKINQIFPKTEIKEFKSNMVYQFEFDFHKRYLIKLIDMNPKHELIITNSEKVVINEDIKGWRRSTQPNFVDGMKDFINVKSENELIKVVLIYPDCHNITKYINESDAYIVEEFKCIDGLYYVKYLQLDKFLKKH